MTLCEMKSSGVEWIGYIPKEWNVKPIYTVFEAVRNKNIDGSETKSLRFSYGKIIPKENFDVSESYVEKTIRSYIKVKPEDIVINGLNLNYDFITKRVAIVEEQGIITSAYLTMRAKYGFFPRFFNYLFKSYDDCRAFHGMGEGVRKILNFSELMKNIVVFPSVLEQEKIASFLDTKCAEIDALCADIEKQIETLQEYKKSVITEAVTKGLDQTVEMKDSNVDYIGKYPFDWKLIKLKYVCQKLDRHFDSDSQILICSNKGTIELRTEQSLGQVSEKKDAFQGVAIGDLLIHGMDTWHGAVGISGFNGKCTKVVHVCSSEQNKTFIAYFLKMLAIKSVYKAISMGVRENTSDFRSWVKAGSIYVTLPEIVKQKEIADYLDKKCSEIDSIIRDKKTQLNTLSLYASSLIYEYVTGKKAVPANF